MATMRPFSSYTLEGNWLEDRSKAPALKGGIADYGFREYTTAARDAFVAPSERPEASRMGRTKLRVGMVTVDTLNEVAFSYGDGATPPQRFDATSTATRARMTAAPEGAVASSSVGTLGGGMRATSTARDSVAAATLYSPAAATGAAADERKLHASVFSPPAGGAGSLRLDRGKKALDKPGAGERLQLGPGGPGHAPVYPVRTVRRQVADAVPDLSILSLQVPSATGVTETGKKATEGAAHGRHAAFPAAPRIVSDVTATQQERTMRRGTHIFADD